MTTPARLSGGMKRSDILATRKLDIERDALSKQDDLEFIRAYFEEPFGAAARITVFVNNRNVIPHTAFHKNKLVVTLDGYRLTLEKDEE